MSNNLKNLSLTKKIIQVISVLEDLFMRIISSRNFLWFLLCLFFLQSLWISVSFNFPMLFDEKFHFGVIEIFSKQYLPLITNQPEIYDTYGYLTFGSASTYHYLLSFPYRFLALFIENQTILIIILRIINIALATLGLWLFNLVFKKIGIKQIFINITLLFYILIPIVTFTAATISYDNLLLPLTALFLLFGLNIILEKKFVLKDYLLFVTIGLLTALVKFTFLSILIVGFLFIGIYTFTKYKKTLSQKFTSSIKKTNNPVQWLLIGIFVLVLSMFSIRYFTPVILYKTPIPSCLTGLSAERCSENNVSKYEETARDTKNSREAEPIQQYALTWLKTILLQLDTSASNTNNGIQIGKSVPVLSVLMSFGALIGVGILIYGWKSLNKNIGWIFLITISLTLVLSVFAFNALSYYSANLDINTQTRYLLSIMPVIMVMSLVSFNASLGKMRALKIFILVIALLLSTQGGGIIKPVLNANDGWYWNNRELQSVNKIIKNTISPYVAE